MPTLLFKYIIIGNTGKNDAVCIHRLRVSDNQPLFGAFIGAVVVH